MKIHSASIKNKDKPRVMILTSASHVSGPVKGIFQFLHRVQPTDVEYHLFNFQVGDRSCEPLHKRAEHEGFHFDYLHQRWRFDPRVFMIAKEQALSKNINIVQSHGYKPSIVALFLKYAIGAKWICFFHGLTAENKKVMSYHCVDRLTHFFADRLVLVSENTRSQVFLSKGSRRVRVIRNAVDPQKPACVSKADADVREELGIPKDSSFLVVIGRLSPEKGIDVFIRAMERLNGGRDSLYGAILGDGLEKAALEQMRERKGLDSRIFFLGHKTNVGDYILAADIVLLPSRSEGIPNALLEAMAFGKPVIATQVGGIPEVISHGSEGLLVPPNDPEKLAETVSRLLADPDLMHKLGQKARETISGRFSVDNRSSEIIRLYRDLLSPNETRA